MKKVKYFQPTGEFDKEGLPIFKSFPGVIVGPRQLVKEAELVIEGGMEKVKTPAVFEYFEGVPGDPAKPTPPGVYRRCVHRGDKYINLDCPAVDLEVNFGTAVMPRYGRVQNALLQKHNPNKETAYYEPVDEPTKGK